MVNLTIKGLPRHLYKSLKQSAAAHRRSINSEVIVCLGQVLGAAPVAPEQLLADARHLRERQGVVVNDQELNSAKRQGRL